MTGLSAQYIRQVQAATALLRETEIDAGAALLADALHHDRGVYVCGNGGSASTASHLAVDLGKNLRTQSGERMRVVSLTDNVPWLTAAANGRGYENCFCAQLRNYLRRGDVVVGISASGDSENVVRAFELARERGADRLALIGFDGGRMAGLATRRVWVDSYDYGIVESLHLIVAHAWVHMLTDAPAPVSRDVSEVLTAGWLAPPPEPSLEGFPAVGSALGRLGRSGERRRTDAAWVARTERERS